MPKVRRAGARSGRGKLNVTHSRFRRARNEASGQLTGRDAKRLEKEEEKRDIERLSKFARSKYGEDKKAQEPHSMVFFRGRVGRYIRKLEKDIRKIMEPNTAARLKVLKRNNLKDFIINGAPLGVTHLIVLTRGEESVTLRIIRIPQGPTLTFHIASYTLAKDIVSAIKRPLHFQKQFAHSPLMVMSGFPDNGSKQLKLLQSMFQSMFPVINIDTLKLSTVRRCFLIKYNSESDTLDLRHYAVKAVPSGVSKPVKKLLQSKVPDLSRYGDISEFFLKPEQLSDSEFEGDQKEVELPQDLTTRGCKKGQATNIRLVEMGPRITMSLVKVEEGINEGEVLYHSRIKKSAQELLELRQNLSMKKKLKEKQLVESEHRVIRRLEKIAERKRQEEEEFEREKQKLIEKQKAVTGDYDHEETSTAESQSLKRKVEDDKEESKKDEPMVKWQKKHDARKDRQSDGLTRATRKIQKSAAAEAIRKKKESKKRLKS